jgi:hypothetical protein
MIKYDELKEYYTKIQQVLATEITTNDDPFLNAKEANLAREYIRLSTELPLIRILNDIEGKADSYIIHESEKFQRFIDDIDNFFGDFHGCGFREVAKRLRAVETDMIGVEILFPVYFFGKEWDD